MAEWISVKDKLPTQCEDVLTYSEIPDEAEIEQWKEEANRWQKLWCIAVDDISKAKIRSNGVLRKS